MPHRRWLYNMDGLNSGPNLSQDYSDYVQKITRDDNDASQKFDYPLSFPWNCEGGGCTCSSMDTLADKQPSTGTNSLPSTTDSCRSTEGNSYVNYSYPSPTDTNAIVAAQIKEGLCPIATGATNECVPQLCGTNPPCQAFWSVPEIEECSDMPCLITPEDKSSQILREPASPQSQSSSPPAKKIRHDSGPTPSSKASESNSDGTRPTRERADTKGSSKHDKKPKPPMDSKQAHSLVEKRYRENLNAKISELHNVLSSGLDGAPEPEIFQARKSDILQTAIDYVNQSQLEMRHLTNDINRLNALVNELNKQVKCTEYNLLKGFDGLKVMTGQPSRDMNSVGASYGMAAPSAA